VGPTLDLCEAVTGKSFCLPGGKELSTEERIFSAVGFGFGSVSKAWSAVKNTGVNPGAKAVAQGVLSLSDEFALALQASRRTSYKTLRGAVGTIANEFEAKAGFYLMKDQGRAMIGVGDDGVRKVLGIPKSGKAPDFLSVTKGNKLALSESKHLLSPPGGEISVSDAREQLENAMKRLSELSLAGDVERVEIIIPKGAKLKDNFAILEGYLVDPAKGNKRVTIDGFKNLIMVIEL
jgi:hypothetical protein